MATTKQCCRTVHDGYSFRGRACMKNATVERDGKPYCSTHDPEKVKARNAERSAKRDRDWAAKKAAWEREAARKQLEQLAGLSHLTDDELRAIIAAGGVQAMLARG